MSRTRRGDFMHGGFGELQFAAVGGDRFFRGGCLRACCSRRDLVGANVAAPGRNQFR